MRLSVVVSFLTGSIKAPYPFPIILSKWPCRQRTHISHRRHAPPCRARGRRIIV
ncbi:hypothetical protein HMPREF3231_00635 [Bifidobacterium longum]|nr:hypothetical protein HMPREF3231_00635 [Bifidobacterium longum]